MLIYLEACGIQRPLDDRTHARIRIEAEAVLGILDYVESGKIHLISSDVLVFEIRQNSNEIRKRIALNVISKTDKYIALCKRN